MGEVDCAASRAPLNFLEDVYDCSMDPSRWPAVLSSVAKVIGGCAAAIITQTPGENTARVHASWNVSTRHERAIVASAPFSPALPAIWLLGVDKAFTTSALFGSEEVRNSLWHKFAFGPEGFGDVAIVPLSKSAGTISTLMVARTGSTGPFPAQEITKLSNLSTHLQRATKLAQLLNYMPLAHHCSSSRFDTASVGVILTDRAGKILHANARGAKILDGCGLLCLEDELAAREHHCNGLLRDAIASAGEINFCRSHDFQPIIIKAWGTTSLALWIAHIRERIRLPFGVPYCARIGVFVGAPEPTDCSPAETFLSRHSVTAGESWLLALLTQGLPLELAADALAISIPNARERLARILQRTNIHDEAELTARLTGKLSLVSA